MTVQASRAPVLALRLKFLLGELAIRLIRRWTKNSMRRPQRILMPARNPSLRYRPDWVNELAQRLYRRRARRALARLGYVLEGRDDEGRDVYSH